MLQQDDIQEDGDTTSELVRYVDMHHVEDIQETTVAIPLGSRLIHVLPSKTLGQQNVIGTAIVGTSRRIELLDLEPTTTAAVCGPDCSEFWKHGPKQHSDSFYDEKQQCTFRFIMNDKKDLIRLARIWGKSESNSHGVILLELPVPEGGSLNWTILQGRNQCYVFSNPDSDWYTAGFELWQLPRARTDRCTLLGVGDASETPDHGRFICTHGCFHRWDGDDRNNVSRFGTSDKELSGSENVLAVWHRIKW